jgi:hypothetical protein
MQTCLTTWKSCPPRRSPSTSGYRKPHQRRIDATEAGIDGLVYELYGLTEEEIPIVEGRV